jgi:hypothetical protein
MYTEVELSGLACFDVRPHFGLQALLEYHLFQPPTPPGGASALLRLFAGFWGSGSSRIGETGARGWAYWCCWHAMGLEPPTQQEQQQEEQQQEQQQQVCTDVQIFDMLSAWVQGDANAGLGPGVGRTGAAGMPWGWNRQG